ncbi:MAG: hypothetical protein IJV95_01055 [Clostridia bacterium]|nr:hypothetical protein [Clostridia bacterium]
MKQLLRKLVLFAVTAVLALGAFAGCSEQDGTQGALSAPKTNLSVPNFSEDLNFNVWADVPANPQVEEYLRVYKEAGFTHYNLTEDWVYTTNADLKFGTADDGVINQKYLDAIELCGDLGLEVLIRNCYGDADWFVNDDDSVRQAAYPWNYTYQIPVRNITNELTNLEPVGGYYMGDEPNWQEVLEYDKLVDWYNAYGGNTLWHMNLLQSYGAFLFEDAEGNMYNYEQYVDHYCENVLEKVNGPKTLGTDYYPLVSGGLSADPYIMDGILSDYFVIANKTKSMIADGHDVRTNFCIQSYENPKNTGAGYVRELTSQADITFQTNLAIAFGAKSLQYYTYRAYGSEPGIVDGSSHEPGKMYPWVQNANTYAHFLADAIFNFSWQGAKVYAGAQGGNTTDIHNKTAFENVKKYVMNKLSLISSVNARLDTVVSEFKDANGNLGYMFVNYSEPSKGLTGDVIMNFSKKINKALIYQNGEKRVVDVTNNKLRITLEAGGGAFVYPVYTMGA